MKKAAIVLALAVLAGCGGGGGLRPPSTAPERPERDPSRVSPRAPSADNRVPGYQPRSAPSLERELLGPAWPRACNPGWQVTSSGLPATPTPVLEWGWTGVETVEAARLCWRYLGEEDWTCYADLPCGLFCPEPDPEGGPCLAEEVWACPTCWCPVKEIDLPAGVWIELGVRAVYLDGTLGEMTVLRTVEEDLLPVCWPLTAEPLPEQ